MGIQSRLPATVSQFVRYSALGLCLATLAGCSSTGDKAETSNRECRTIENLGSRVQRPTCMTKEQWAVIDERNARAQEENGRETQDALRRSLEQGSMVQGRSFDTPGGGY